ncbi:uncharacterized protein PHALS_14695 [Plasmopara halstedii]|uniref:Uncharacterized protein n=1 Tax=Plasmopara halstedii TaxID=4781 RepID=A0A0N7L646_PLAHL|nr:uncharacterized protein PHALS_14695 [Plasmopara halstedii]CEG43259.1 hypothetical protein PHALS_14695 [Plasmopara halstedii]|eukprot:XP_024579628.1 hypothetical protein PHALS_14695 [Plasmopara halstedii]
MMSSFVTTILRSRRPLYTRVGIHEKDNLRDGMESTECKVASFFKARVTFALHLSQGTSAM